MTYGIICLLTAVLSAAGTWLMCKYLLSRLGMRELGIKEIPLTVRDVPGEGEYVPRCGGLIPAFAVFISSAVMLLIYGFVSEIGGIAGISRLSGVQSMYIRGGILMAALFCAAGFLEDYAIVFRNMRRGMASWKRLLIQAAIAAAFLAAVWLSGDKGKGLTIIPFAGEVQMGIWYYPLSLLLILAVVRGAELAQEADGVMPVAGFFSFIPFIVASGFLSVYNAGISDVGVMAVAGAGGCLAFIPYNYASVQTHTGIAGGAFMGALLCGVAFASRTPILLLLCGAVYIAEAVTALVAWVSEKLTGRAVGAPLHRMIGRMGRNDIQITTVFAAVTAVLGAVSAALAVLGR